MITDNILNFTRDPATGSMVQWFSSAGGQSRNVIDMQAAGRTELATGEPLVAVFHIAGNPVGNFTSIQFSVEGSNTITGGAGSEAISGPIVLGASRGYIPGDFAITQVSTTLDSSTDTFTANGHGLVAGTAIYLGGTALPSTTGAAVDFTQALYVIAAATNTFQLARTVGGAAIDFTSTGTSLSYRLPDNGATTGLAGSWPVVVKFDVDMTHRGFRYVQARATVTGGVANNTNIPVTAVLTHDHHDQQRFRSYPSGITLNVVSTGVP